MKKAKVLIALMLVISLVFPNAGMAAGSVKDISGTKEVSGKPEIKILECQWLSRDDRESPWKKFDESYDFAKSDDGYTEFKNEIKISSNQKLTEDTISMEYRFQGEGNVLTDIVYDIVPTNNENIYLLKMQEDYDVIRLNKYNGNENLTDEKVYSSTGLYYSAPGLEGDYYRLDEILLDVTNNPLSIKVLNMVDDFDAPVLKNISITKPEGQIHSTDNIRIEAEIEENISGVEDIFLNYNCIFENDSNEESKSYSIYLHHEDGNIYAYEGEAFNDGYAPNHIKLETLWMSDYAGNIRTYGYNSSEEGNIHKLPVDINLDMSFIDGNDAQDTTGPTLTDIIITNNNGEEKNIFEENEWPLQVTATAEDDKAGVAYIWLEYENKETGETLDINLEGEGNEFTSTEYNFGCNGKYELNNIQLQDKSGNHSTYTYSGVNEWGEPCKKLDKNIDLTFNTDKPVLKDIKITDANGNEKYTFDENDEYYNIEALAEDKGSGVEYIEVYYTNSKNGKSDSFCLYEESGKFISEEHIYRAPKKYTLEKIIVYDNSRNESIYTYSGVDENGEKCEKMPNGKNIDIHFENGSDENIAPTIEFYTVDKSEVLVPGSLTGKIKVSDNESKMIEMTACYENISNPDNTFLIYEEIERDKETNFSYPFEKSHKNEQYRLKYIELIDENNNVVYYGKEEDLDYCDGEHREFNDKIDQKTIKLKNTYYIDFIKLNDLKDASKVAEYKENSRVHVMAKAGEQITPEMLENIKKANKNVDFAFEVVDEDEMEGIIERNDFIFNSNAITDEYIRSLSGKGIVLDMSYENREDSSFIENVALKILDEKNLEKLFMNWEMGGPGTAEDYSNAIREIITKSDCEELIPFIENYASKQKISFFDAAEKLLKGYYISFNTGSNGDIKFPKGSRFEMDHYYGFMDNVPLKVYYEGQDFNNLKEYKASTPNLFEGYVVIEDPGTYFITKGTFGYKDAIIDISDAKVTGITDSYFTGGAITQNVIVNCGTRNLVKDRDYKVTYENNVNAGIAKVIITGMGAYKGQIVKTFTISKRASTLNVPTSRFNKTYGNSRFNLGVSSNTKVSYVSSNSNVASVDQSGNVTIKGVGIVNITVTALGNGNYTPVQKSIVVSVGKGTASVKASNYKKTRSSKKFKVKASSTSGGKLTYSSSNKKVATVSKSGYVTIKGIGKTTITIKSAATSKYNASYKKITVQVVPKTMKINKIKAGKKSMKVYWSKDKYVSGYQVVIAKDKKFKKGKKTYKISKNKYTSKNISKLSKRKYYYVKMRSYKKVGKTYYYSNYSSVKKIKTK